MTTIAGFASPARQNSFLRIHLRSLHPRDCQIPQAPGGREAGTMESALSEAEGVLEQEENKVLRAQIELIQLGPSFNNVFR